MENNFWSSAIKSVVVKRQTISELPYEHCNYIRRLTGWLWLHFCPFQPSSKFLYITEVRRCYTEWRLENAKTDRGAVIQKYVVSFRKMFKLLEMFVSCLQLIKFHEGEK